MRTLVILDLGKMSVCQERWFHNEADFHQSPSLVLKVRMFVCYCLPRGQTPLHRHVEHYFPIIFLPSCVFSLLKVFIKGIQCLVKNLEAVSVVLWRLLNTSFITEQFAKSISILLREFLIDPMFHSINWIVVMSCLFYSFFGNLYTLYIHNIFGTLSVPSLVI